MSSTNSIFENVMNYRSGKMNSDTKQAAKQEAKREAKLKPSEKLLEDIKSYGYEMSQLEPMLKQKGNQLIISIAGSGKTTGLIFKIIYDLKTGNATRLMNVNGNTVRIPEKIWVSTFLKTGAEELEASLRTWQRKLGCVDVSKCIQFSTLHAEFKRVLNQMGMATDIISASENTKLLKEVVKSFALLNDNGKPLNSENYRDLESALAYTRNRLDNKRYNKPIYDELNLGHTLVDAILRDWKSARIKSGKVDFEDLQEILYTECYEKSNEDVIDTLSKRYNFIYIDEFQDISQIQYALLKIYASSAKQVVAIGDDDQTIYSWRGSDNKIITEKFLEDFSPVKNNLSLNFRCPSNILNAIKPSIEQNNHRFKKELKSFKEGGLVRYGEYSSYKGMVDALSDMMYEDVKEGLSVAVLCRVNSDGLMPALVLDKLNTITFSISGEGMTLDSYIGRTILNIIKLFTEKSTPAVKSALGLLSWDTYAINSLMRVCKTNKVSIWDVDAEDLSWSCPDIADRIMTWRSWRRDMGEMKALKLVLQDYRTRIFSKDNHFNTVMRSMLLSIESLLSYFSCDYVEDFLMELEDMNDRLKARRQLSGNVQVRIATVHEFKGKEADSIYVWNDTQDIFPYKDSVADEDDLEEERRIHYIACTRARKKSTILSIRRACGMFVQEMDLSEAELLNTSNSDSVVSDIIKERSEQEMNLQRFEESCVQEEQGYVNGDNTSWEEDWDYVSRYSTAAIDFENKMRRK